jgi:hypothetical protein
MEMTMARMPAAMTLSINAPSGDAGRRALLGGALTSIVHEPAVAGVWCAIGGDVGE